MSNTVVVHKVAVSFTAYPFSERLKTAMKMLWGGSFEFSGVLNDVKESYEEEIIPDKSHLEAARDLSQRM